MEFFLYSGTLADIPADIGELINVYHITDASSSNFGSIWSEPLKIPNTDILLLPDLNKGEVFSYNLTSRHKQSILADFLVLAVCLTASIKALLYMSSVNITDT